MKFDQKKKFGNEILTFVKGSKRRENQRNFKQTTRPRQTIHQELALE